jgi:hypothetical protein
VMAPTLDEQNCTPASLQVASHQATELTASEADRRTALIAPLTSGLKAIATKGQNNRSLTTEDVDCLKRLITLVQLANLESLEFFRAPVLTMAEAKKHALLIAPLIAGIKAIRTKGQNTGSLTSEDIEFLLRLNTLVKLSDLDSLECLPFLYRVMPKSWLA